MRTAIDRPEWDIEVAASTPDGTVQAWAVNVDGYSTLRWRTGDGRGGEHELGGVVGDIAISADGSQLAFFRYSAASLPELRVLRTSDSHVRTVYRVESEADLSLAEPELVRVPASDGPIPVFVFMPKVHAGAVPAVLVIHGGPEAQSRPVPGIPLLRALLARGIAIVMPNIHGSTGYGKSWQTSIHHDWGGADMEDWPAFNTSFTAFVELLEDLGGTHRQKPPATISVLSGDIHFSYASELIFPDGHPMASRVHQLVNSPIRNALRPSSPSAWRVTW